MAFPYTIWRCLRHGCSRVWDEIAKPKRIPANDFAKRKFYGCAKNRPVEYKGVKLAVLTARIDVGRQFGEKIFIYHAACERRIELLRIDAHDDRFESFPDEFPHQSGRIPLPDRVKSGHTVPRKKPVPIVFDVFEKQIAKGNRLNPPRLKKRERFGYIRFIFGVACALGYEDLVKLQTKAVGLAFEQAPPYAMHADPVEIARNRREQSLDAYVCVLHQF